MHNVLWMTQLALVEQKLFIKTWFEFLYSKNNCGIFFLQKTFYPGTNRAKYLKFNIEKNNAYVPNYVLVHFVHLVFVFCCVWKKESIASLIVNLNIFFFFYVYLCSRITSRDNTPYVHILSSYILIFICSNCFVCFMKKKKTIF